MTSRHLCAFWILWFHPANLEWPFSAPLTVSNSPCMISCSLVTVTACTACIILRYSSFCNTWKMSMSDRLFMRMSMTANLTCVLLAVVYSVHSPKWQHYWDNGLDGTDWQRDRLHQDNTHPATLLTSSCGVPQLKLNMWNNYNGLQWNWFY